MPRPNVPWFRKSKNTWYVTLDGRQVSLGVNGRSNRKAALLAFAELLARRTPAGPPSESLASSSPVPPTAPQLPSSLTVAGVVERFLAVAGARLKARTVDRYRKDAGALAELLGPTPADQVTGDALLRWAAGMNVSDTTRSIALRSVSAVFGWAVRVKLVRENPARGLPMPRTRAWWGGGRRRRGP